MHFQNSFWGECFEGKGPHKVQPTYPLHISSIVLGPHVKKGERITISMKPDADSKPFVICVLTAGRTEQVAMRQYVEMGQEIFFTLSGGSVHFSGYYMIPDDDLDPYGDDSDEEDDDAAQAFLQQAIRLKMKELEEAGDLSDEEDDEDFEEGSDEEESEEEEEEESDEEDEQPTPKKAKVDESLRISKQQAKAKLQEAIKAEKEKKEKEAALAGKKEKLAKAKELAAKKKAVEEEKRKKAELENKKRMQELEKKKKEEANKKSPSTEFKDGPGGLKFRDLVVGKGQLPKKGKKVKVHYTGTLMNGKKFDSSRGRGPFQFRLGVGEVIRGWDIGVASMRVGGRRHLQLPASLGYGKRGAPPDIPGNATLNFDVELLGC